jgi:hypothetical protein
MTDHIEIQDFLERRGHLNKVAQDTTTAQIRIEFDENEEKKRKQSYLTCAQQLRQAKENAKEEIKKLKEHVKQIEAETEKRLTDLINGFADETRDVYLVPYHCPTRNRWFMRLYDNETLKLVGERPMTAAEAQLTLESRD